MSLGRMLLSELKKLLAPAEPQPAPARVRRQPAQEWIARTRCW